MLTEGISYQPMLSAPSPPFQTFKTLILLEEKVVVLLIFTRPPAHNTRHMWFSTKGKFIARFNAILFNFSPKMLRYGKTQIFLYPPLFTLSWDEGCEINHSMNVLLHAPP
jgi:hypothetical protein